MEKTLDQLFGDALRFLREAAGKTQEDFSIGRTYLSELERGLKTPTLDTIVRLAKELGTTPARIVAIATGTTAAADQLPKSPLPSALSEGIAAAAAHIGGTASASFLEITTLSQVDEAITCAGIELPRLLAEAALVAFRSAQGKGIRMRRQALRFIVADKRPAAALQYAQNNMIPWSFTPAAALRALEQANVTLELANDVLGMNGIPFYELLGTRNLGSFVGAVFAYSLQREMPERLRVNGHQDGYPDLCALTEKGKRYIQKIEAEGMETAKKSWAFYPEGGIEVKTTCGSVPTPTKKRRKPQIGDQRTGQLTGADWKAHHRETNRLLGLFWDDLPNRNRTSASYRNSRSPGRSDCDLIRTTHFKNMIRVMHNFAARSRIQVSDHDEPVVIAAMICLRPFTVGKQDLPFDQLHSLHFDRQFG